MCAGLTFKNSSRSPDFTFDDDGDGKGRVVSSTTVASPFPNDRTLANIVLREASTAQATKYTSPAQGVDKDRTI